MPAVTLTEVSGTAGPLLGTELNGLASGALALGAVITPTPLNYLQAEVELVVTFATAPTPNVAVVIWLLRAIDGVNYEDGSPSVTPGRWPDLVFMVRSSTSPQRITRRVVLPPGSFKALLKN